MPLLWIVASSPKHQHSTTLTLNNITIQGYNLNDVLSMLDPSEEMRIDSIGPSIRPSMDHIRSMD